jgi:hypothetical protein
MQGRKKIMISIVMMIMNGRAKYQRSEAGCMAAYDQVGSASAQHRALIRINSLGPK